MTTDREQELALWLQRARAALSEARKNRTPEVRVKVEPDPLDEVTLRGMAWLNDLAEGRDS